MNEYLSKFIDFLEVENNDSPLTVSTYTREIREDLGFVCDLKDRPDVDALTPADLDEAGLRSYTGYLRRVKKLSRASIQRALSALRTFVYVLVREGAMESSPAHSLNMPRQDKKLPRFLYQEEARRLVEAPDTSTLAGLRDRAILELIYGSGLREAEAAALNVGDIDFRYGYVTVLGKVPACARSRWAGKPTKR